jgi:hypothetical protein
MKKFDHEKVLDNLSRGFCDGHFDGGYGREGVSQNAYETQKEGRSKVCAKPAMINFNAQVYRKFGNVLDRMQQLLDHCVYDNDELLMNDPYRDEEFGKPLRAKTGSKLARFDGWTLVRQRLGFKETLDNRFYGVHRHTDGPDDWAPTYMCVLVPCRVGSSNLPHVPYWLHKGLCWELVPTQSFCPPSSSKNS